MLTKLFFSHFYCTEKPFTKYLNNKFFSIYNYLFRFFFLYSVFNEHLVPHSRNSWKLKVESWKLNNFPFSIFHSQLRTPCAWWRWWDSNPWPPACRAGALPAELHPHGVYFFVSLGVDCSTPWPMSALSYLPVQSPVKYFHHCRA